MKKIFMVALILFAVTTLSACGKSARPIPYPNSGYPHTYPNNN